LSSCMSSFDHSKMMPSAAVTLSSSSQEPQEDCMEKNELPLMLP